MVNSPCIKVCKVDPNSYICTGCYRTLEEIAKWLQYTEQEKVAVLNNCLVRSLTKVS
jgi:predicted Fe-S protein YdhL (DUF1289 family)